MDTSQYLQTRKEEILKAIRDQQEELRDIDTALNAINSSHSKSDNRHSMLRQPKIRAPKALTIDEAVVEAVNNGRKKPMVIFDFVSSQLGIKTTINSVRTRLTKLKNDGKIAKSVDGWVMPNESNG
ncbi:MAG: hypothetical protein L3J33_04580 [Rhodobacteraceae bacterium]|nr:hypothetical protein [Paracoccaceae bacterium]